MFKVAAVQYPLAEGLKPETFYGKVTGYIDDAKAHGAGLVVFPELLTTELIDWEEGFIAKLASLAREFTPSYHAWLKNQATTKQIAILGGTSPRLVRESDTGPTIVNTAVLAMPDGRLLLQDKLFLTPDEKQWGWSGGHELHVFNTPWGKTAIAICFDCEFPTVTSLLANEKPDVILVPSWTSTHSGLNRVDFTARARAVEHFAYVVKTGTVPDLKSSQSHFGQASIHTPQEVGFSRKSQRRPFERAGISFRGVESRASRREKEKLGLLPEP